MNLHLQEKVIIVSGGAKGIGEGISTLLAHEGAIPVIIGRDENDNNKFVASLQANGYKAGQV
jgi:L-fucose dehydrogenase